MKQILKYSIISFVIVRFLDMKNFISFRFQTHSNDMALVLTSSLILESEEVREVEPAKSSSAVWANSNVTLLEPSLFAQLVFCT